MKKVVVSDTGVLISLETLQSGFELARKLFDKIIIPAAVADEVSRRYNSLSHYCKRHNLGNFIETTKSEIDFQIRGVKTLHEGEAQAISLAFQLGVPLLIEETKGRRVASAAGVKVAGAGGVVAAAAHLKIINSQEALAMVGELLKNGRINRKVYNILSSEIMKE